MGKRVLWFDGENIFKLLGMDYIAPELREDTGEVELAIGQELPKLVNQHQIRCDLHIHSDFSDGKNSINELAEKAKSEGYSYIAITDHSQGLRVAGGLSPAKLKKKKKEIERINKDLKGIQVLYGAEVDIDSQGRLDYSDRLLSGFDIVIAAIHSGFKQSKAKITQRLIKACRNQYVNIIAHPTGRLWGWRDAYEVDFQQLFSICRDTNTALEINSYPDRLDLNDSNARQAKNAGVRLALGSDAHSIEGLDRMLFGVSVARRAWLEKSDLLNTLTLTNFLKAIRK